MSIGFLLGNSFGGKRQSSGNRMPTEKEYADNKRQNEQIKSAMKSPRYEKYLEGEISYKELINV